MLSFAERLGGESAQQALQAEFENLKLANALGYRRYWIAEHRIPTNVYGASAVLVGILASLDCNIRVGSAGVLLNCESPHRVAEDFRLLSLLYPERIDLGVCPGTGDAAMQQSLLDGRSAAEAPDYGAKLERLVRLVRGHGDAPICPAECAVPPVWVLTSGGESVRDAARLSTFLAISLLHVCARRHATPAAIARYKDSFRPTPECPRPVWALAVAGVCAETAREAKQEVARLTNPYITCHVVGDPAQCREQIEELATRFGTTDLVFLDVSRSRDRKRASIELFADALRLKSRSAAV